MYKPPFKVEDRFKLTELKLICLDIFRLVNVVRQFLHSGTNGLFLSFTSLQGQVAAIYNTLDICCQGSLQFTRQVALESVLS